MFWRLSFYLYSLFLSWQLLTPVTIISAGGNDKLLHFVAFFILAGLANLAKPSAWAALRPNHMLLLALLGYALLTECLQYFIPGRSFSWFDFLADAAGILFAFSLFLVYFKKYI